MGEANKSRGNVLIGAVVVLTTLSTVSFVGRVRGRQLPMVMIAFTFQGLCESLIARSSIFRTLHCQI